MSVGLIVAMTDEGVIGKDNTLPWRLPEDLARFKKITLGHPIIMGRKTYESIGRPLPGRTMIVVTSQPCGAAAGVESVNRLDAAFQRAASVSEDCFVIGGARIFEEAFPYVNTLYLTLIHAPIAGDVYFPIKNWREGFVVREESHHSAGTGGLPYSFLTLTRHA